MLVGSAHQATAQNATFASWQGGGTNWSDTNNWNNAFTFAQLSWSGAGNATSWNNLNSSVQWRLFFGSNAIAYTLAGNHLQLTNASNTSAGGRGGILSDSTVLQSINMNLGFVDADASRAMFVLTRGSGGLAFGGTVTLTNGGGAFGIGGSNTSSIISFNNTIAGTKPVVVGTNAFDGNSTGMGATRAVFTGDNTYTGATTVAAGSLTISHANALGATNSGTTVVGGASLNLSNGITVTGETLTLAGTGLSNLGALRSVSGSNAYTGLINFSGVTTTYVGAAAGATLVLSNVNAETREFWIVGDGTTVVAGGATNSGAGTAFVKINAGTAVLMSSNAWSGNEFIRAGTVVLSNNNALGAGGTTTIGAVSGDNSTATLTLGQNIINSNAISVQSGGNGVRTLGYQSATGTGTQLGSITLNTNSLAFNVTNNGTLLFGGGVTVNTDGAGNNRLAVDGGGTLLVTNNGTGMADSDRYQVRVGNGTMVIGSGTISARTNVSVGMGHAIDLGVNLFGVLVNATSALRASNGVTISNSIYVGTTNNQARILGASGASAAVTYSGQIGLGGSPVTIDATNGQTVTISGPITNVFGTGSLVKTNAGLAILGGDNTYSGTTTVTNGTLRVASSTALGNTAGGTVVGSGATLELSNNVNVVGEVINLNGAGVGGNGALRNVSGNNTNTGTLTLLSASRIQTEAGTTLTQSGTVNNGGHSLTVSSAGTTVISGAITNAGGIIQSGTGTLTLSGNNTFSGAVSVQAGTLELAGSEGNKAGGSTSTVSVASGATLLLAQGSQFNNAAAVTLSGGTIQRGSGVSEVFGSLALGSASFLDFGTGTVGTLAFGTYTPSALITVQNFLPGNKLTFGSDLTSSIGNTSLFSFQGDFNSSWNGTTFTITAIPEPSTLCVAAGLFVLVAFPFCRKAMKRMLPALPFQASRRAS